MRKLVGWLLIAALPTLAWAAQEDQSKAQDRVNAAATVLEEIQSAPDQGIPEEVLGSAECVAVVPSMIKGGFIFGARYGRGVASCRYPKWLERTSVFHDHRRQLWTSDWRPGSRSRHADHE